MQLPTVAEEPTEISFVEFAAPTIQLVLENWISTYKFLSRDFEL